MAKSNYPASLDTSKEIPAVRDNILEIGSEAINGLRTAIFNIEKTLGINPHGIVGNTVSNRINISLDGNGNIRKDALTLANVLSGPITDADVSNVAAISEDKLRLAFPTQVLQDEISIVNSELSSIIAEIVALSTSLAAHLHSAAINRHKAAAISTAPITAIGSDTSIINIEADDVQEAFEDLHNRHINYTGSGISSTNNSHQAYQIYFDDDDVNGLLTADDVQEAIEKTILLTDLQTIAHQGFMHTNGYLRKGYITDPTSSLLGLILAEQISATFSTSSGDSDGLTLITPNTPITLSGFDLKIGDLVYIEDIIDIDNLYTGTFQIAKINLSTDLSKVQSVEICALLHGGSTSTTKVTIAKNPHKTQNVAGLLLSVREKALLTSANAIQIANPNAVAVVSSGVKPSEITSTNKLITLSVDGASDIILNLYDAGSIHQSVDSIIKRINEQCVESNYNFSAYRLNLEDGGVEFVIVHNLPDTEIINHTFKVGQSTDNGIVAAGLDYIQDETFYSEIGSKYYIAGIPYTGLKEKLNTTGLSFFSGSTSISIGNTSVNFLELDIKIGDILVISNAVNSGDNGSFVISGISSTSIILSSDQLPSGFVNASTDTTLFEIYDSILNLDTLVFDKVSGGYGTAIVEAYLDENQKAQWNKRLEYSASISGIDAIFSIVDYTDTIITDDELSIIIEIENSEVKISLDGGTKTRIEGNDIYLWIHSGIENRSLKIHIPSAAILEAYLTINGTTTTTVYGFNSLNQKSSLLLGKIPYSNFKGRVTGGVGTDNSRIFSSISKGTVGWEDLHTQAIANIIERPIYEMRTGGIIRGLELTDCTISSGLYSITIDAGVCYVRGKRFVLDTITIITDIPSSSVDKFYIAVNLEGEIVFAPAISGSCNNPFAESDYVLIATIEYDNTTVRILDLRLFISNLDMKLLNAVSVSPDPKFGHFSSFPKAVKYVKRFSDLFPASGTPSVHLKSGVHEVTVEIDHSDITLGDYMISLIFDPITTGNEIYTEIYNQGVIIDFPLNIIGEGNSSVLKFRIKIICSDTTVYLRGILPIVGGGFAVITVPVDALTNGFVKFSDFKLENTRLELIDLNLDDGAGTNYSFGIELDSLIFDFTNFTTNAIDSLLGSMSIILGEISDTSSNKGNIRINNCKFIACKVSVEETSRIQNLQFCNNIKLQDSGGDFFNEDILSFASVADGANIDIYGNCISDNHNDMSNVSAPEFSSGVKLGTRSEANQYIGGFIESSDYIKGDSFEYNASKDAYKYIHVDQLSEIAMGIPIPGMSFTVINNGTRFVKVIRDNNSITDYCIIRLPDLMAGQTMTQIEVSFYTSGASFSSYDYEIYSEDLNLTRTLESSGTGTVGLHGGAATLGFSRASGLSISGANNKFFYVKFLRTSVVDEQYIVDIRYKVTISDVQSIGGF